MPTTSVEQVIDTVIDKRAQKKDEKNILSMLGMEFQMSDEELKNYLTPEDSGIVTESIFSGGFDTIFSKFKTNILSSVKAFFTPELGKLKEYLELNQNNSVALLALKQTIEKQHTLNIKQALETVRNSSVTNIQSNPSYENSEYIGPYSIEYYEQMKTAQKLGNIVVEKGPRPQNRKNYCGAGVRSILTEYMGFSGFPTSGADGKEWGKILETSNITTKNGEKVIFKKVKVNTPFDVKPGGIVYYDADAQLGSEARKGLGHVEVQGADKNWYFDMKAQTPGGSARVSLAEARDMSPQEYKEKTGFSGYVYYPVIEGELNQAA